VSSRRSSARTGCRCRSRSRLAGRRRVRHVHRCCWRRQELTETRLAQASLAEVEQRFSEWKRLPTLALAVDVGTDAVQWSDELHRMHGVDPLDFEGTLAAHLGVVHPTIVSGCAR